VKEFEFLKLLYFKCIVIVDPNAKDKKD